jgi:purine-binding chemotaxis protein CheW
MDNAANNADVTPVATQSVEQFLTFQLMGQLYGVEILRVQEIKGWEKPTRLPHSPEYVQGVINLRGAVVPILDLRRRFGLGEAEQGRTTVVIVVKVESARGELTAGMVVDGVCEVSNIAPQDLQPPPEMATATIDTDFVRGLAMVDGKMLILLNVVRLIGSAFAETTIGTKAA